MNVLYISTVFPREKESSTIYTDLAEELVKCGHTVTVLVAEEKKRARKTTISTERACKVVRVKTGNMYDVNFIEKGLSIITLPFFLKMALLQYLAKDSYELILFEAPPVTLESVIKVAKKLFNAPVFLMMKDIFPQNAVDIGIMRKDSLAYKYFLYKEKKLYSVTDRIGCMSKGNLAYVATHNSLPIKKLSIFPNTKKVHVLEKKDLSIRKKYNIPEDKIVFIFGGNMGKPQGLSFLSSAIKECYNIEKAFFVLVGRGTEKEFVKQRVKDSSNVIVLDNMPRDEYEQLVYSCDVGIVSLDYRFTIPNYPSRVLSYMEYGMPVLATTDQHTDFRNLIEEEAKCGVWTPSNSIKKFVNAVIMLSNDSRQRKILGENGRRYLIENLQVIKSVELLEKFVFDFKS